MKFGAKSWAIDPQCLRAAQNRPYIASFIGIFSDNSRSWRSVSKGCVYAPYATLGASVLK